MGTINWRPTPQGREPVMDTCDWRNHLHPDSRQKIATRCIFLFSGQEGMNEVKKIAERFEEKIYTAATSQSDYLRKISSKMLSMESKSQDPMPSSLPSNTAGNSHKPPDQDQMDWDKNRMVNSEESQFAFTNWVGIDDEEEGEERV